MPTEEHKQNTSGLNIYQRLEKVRAMTEALNKDKSGYGYTYTSIEAILPKVTAGIKKYGLSLVPKIVPGTTSVTPYKTTTIKMSKSGDQYEQTNNEIIVRSDMVYVWVNNDNPTETIEVPWTLIGHQSNASQAFGSGLSYCERYFLRQYFHIAETDDIDQYVKGQKEAIDAEDREISARINETTISLINKYLETNNNDVSKRDEILAIVKRYTKKYSKNKSNPDGNPMVITSQVDAAALLKSIRAATGGVNDTDTNNKEDK